MGKARGMKRVKVGESSTASTSQRCDIQDTQFLCTFSAHIVLGLLHTQFMRFSSVRSKMSPESTGLITTTILI